MFERFFHPAHAAATPPPPIPDVAPPGGSGDTATVRRIVAKLEAMPPEQARFVAASAYILARAANADMQITDDETHAIELELEDEDGLDEATAVLVTEMAKLQAKTVGGTEDYVVTREFKAISTADQRLRIVRACFAIGAASGTISAEETAVVNEIAGELDIDASTLNGIRAEFHEQLSSVQAIRRVTGESGQSA